MKNAILGLRTAIYQVSDLSAATEWYTKAFDTRPYFNEPFYVGFDIGGYELGLQPQEHAAQKEESVVAYWGVDDVESRYAGWLDIGATGYEAPQEVGGGIIVAKVKDPFGNIIGLIHNPHFKVGS